MEKNRKKAGHGLKPPESHHGKGKLLSGEQVNIPENAVRLDLSEQKDYEHMFDFNFPSYQRELADDLEDYLLPV